MSNNTKELLGIRKRVSQSSHYSDYQKVGCVYFNSESSNIRLLDIEENDYSNHILNASDNFTVTIFPDQINANNSQNNSHSKINEWHIKSGNTEALLHATNWIQNSQSHNFNCIKRSKGRAFIGNSFTSNGVYVESIDDVSFNGTFHALNKHKPKLEYTPQPLELLIQKASEIKDLELDWDEDGALKIDEITFNTATGFLKTYVNYLKSKLKVEVKLPAINPCKDGSIDLEWHTVNAQLLVNIRKSNQQKFIAYYYGDLHNDKMQFKGSIPVNDFSEHFAVWMKYLA